MTVNTLGSKATEGGSRAAWLWPLVPVAVAAFSLSALVAYHVRADGRLGERSLPQAAIIGLYEFLGFVPSFLFFLLVLAWSTIWLVTGKLERPGTRVVRLLGLTLALAIWVNLRADTGEPLPHSGALGTWIGGRMVSALGTVLSTLLVAPLTLVSLLLATDYFFISYFEGLGNRGGDERGRAARRTAEAPEAGVEIDVTEHFKGLSALLAPERRPRAPAPAADARAAVEAPADADAVAARAPAGAIDTDD